MPQKIQLERSSLQVGIVASGGPKRIQRMIKKKKRMVRKARQKSNL
jgi:hypothetical protein